MIRDVMARNALTNEKEIKELVSYLASNATRRITYSSLGKIIGIRHAETVKNYLEYNSHCSGMGMDADMIKGACHRKTGKNFMRVT